MAFVHFWVKLQTLDNHPFKAHTKQKFEGIGDASKEWSGSSSALVTEMMETPLSTDVLLSEYAKASLKMQTHYLIRMFK